jgi:hypothetical protein
MEVYKDTGTHASSSDPSQNHSTGTPNANPPHRDPANTAQQRTPTHTYRGVPIRAKGPPTQAPLPVSPRAPPSPNNHRDTELTQTSLNIRLTHGTPKWESLRIGTQPPPSVGYETPTHLLPFKTAIRAELFRPGPIRDFPLHLIPPRDQCPFYHDQLHDYYAQRTAAEIALRSIYLNQAAD